MDSDKNEVCEVSVQVCAVIGLFDLSLSAIGLYYLVSVICSLEWAMDEIGASSLALSSFCVGYQFCLVSGKGVFLFFSHATSYYRN